MSSSLLLMTFLVSLSVAGGFRGDCPPQAPPDIGAKEPAHVPSPAVDIRVVQVNRAGPDELCALPGVGPARAQAIIHARQRRPFSRLSDLGRVKGLGPKRVQALAGRIGFDPPVRGRDGEPGPG